MLIEAYKRCLSTLSHCLSGLLDGEQPISLSLAGHSVDTFRYQVSQDKVSIHLPVCRLLAGTPTGFSSLCSVSGWVELNHLLFLRTSCSPQPDGGPVSSSRAAPPGQSLSASAASCKCLLV